MSGKIFNLIKMKKLIYTLSFILLITVTRAQEPIGIEVKSNLLNLVAKRPSFSIEKTFSNKYGIELSYTSGELNIGRYYKYDGFLLRAKKYADEIKPGNLIPFYGLYLGNLNKTISKDGYVDRTGFISVASRNFMANSVRAGGNIGFLFIPKKRFLLETTGGLGYGKYFNVTNYASNPNPKGYLDFQFWLSAGYIF